DCRLRSGVLMPDIWSPETYFKSAEEAPAWVQSMSVSHYRSTAHRPPPGVWGSEWRQGTTKWYQSEIKL
ncbi:hypothetical protein ACLOJK_022585, partial [Asimina triloba]